MQSRSTNPGGWIPQGKWPSRHRADCVTPHVDSAFHAQVMSTNRHSGMTNIVTGVLSALCAAFVRASDIFARLECAGNSNHPVEFLGAHDTKPKHTKPRATVSASGTDVSGRHMMSTDDSETFSDSDGDIFWTNKFFGQMGIRAEHGAECTPDHMFAATIDRTNLDPGCPGSDKFQSGIFDRLFVGPENQTNLDLGNDMLSHLSDPV